MAGMTSLSLSRSWLMLFLLVFLVKVCVQKRSYDQEKCKTMTVEIVGFADLVKDNYKISYTKIFALKVNS